jgi:hypothetical protein
MLDLVNSFLVNLLKKNNISVIFLAMQYKEGQMEGFTVKEMAGMLGIKETTVRQRLMVAGIRPKTKSPIYDKSALEAIQNVPSKGRPPKVKPEAETKD